MSTLLQDLRYGLRAISRRPGFAAVAVLTLALGIGANTALYSLLSAVLVRPMPGLTDPQRLVWVTPTSRDGRERNFAYPNYLEYRARSDVFSGLAAWTNVSLALASGGAPTRIAGQVVSGDYFSVLGVRFAHGRGFVPEEDATPGTHPVVVMSHRLWRTRFGSDPAIVGRSIVINGRLFAVVGITAAEFVGAELGDPPGVWLPMAMVAVANAGLERARSERGSWWLTAVGRLRDGATVEGAERALRPLALQHQRDYPGLMDGIGIRVRQLRGGVTPRNAGDVVPIVILGFAVTGLVLLIACANVANLQLGRALARRREIGVRLALGAGRWRLVRQLLTESVLLALMAGAAGILLAVWLTDAVMAMIGSPFELNVTPDRSVLGFTTAVAVGTGLLFGFAPALHATARAVAPALKQDAGGTGWRRSRLQTTLVVAQVALSLVLLVTAGLFLRSLQKAQEVDVGFDGRRDVAVLSFDLHQLAYDSARTMAFHSQLLERVRAMPGVRDASLGDVVPLSGRMVGIMVFPEGVPHDPNAGEMGPNVGSATVYPGFLSTLGVPLVKGRDFSAADRRGAPDVVIVNEEAARVFWPGQDPIGKRLTEDPASDRWLEVIGVARDGKYDALSDDVRPFVYLPFAQQGHPSAEISLLVRTSGDAGLRLEALAREVRAIDPTLPVYDVRTLEDVLERRASERRSGAAILAAFGGLALILATVGVYAVMAHAVGARTREIGVRVALGAGRRDVVRLFVGEGTRLAGIGVLAGLALALALTQLLRGLIFGVAATDVMTFAAVSTLLLGAALLAAWLPARRAARVDPVAALRSE